jgi:hypothetical protein
VIQTLFTWRVTLHSISDCSFSDFLDLCYSFFLLLLLLLLFFFFFFLIRDLCSSFSLDYGYHVYFLYTLSCTPLCFFEIYFTYQYTHTHTHTHTHTSCGSEFVVSKIGRKKIHAFSTTCITITVVALREICEYSALSFLYI